MPELPEVESLRQLLAHHVTHARIVDACFPSPVILRNKTASEFQAEVTGREIEGIERRGKYLLFALRTCVNPDIEPSAERSESRLVIHLRMRGGMRVEPGGSIPGKYLCGVLRLEDGRELRFYDMWRWGEWWLVPPDPQLTGIAGLDELGIEPFDAEFTTPFLIWALKKHRTPIKPLLLGQRVVAGLGNIYCDDSLHRAGLHPSRPANSLSVEEVARLREAIVAVLGGAVRESGITVQRLMAAGENLETFEGLSSQQVYDRPGFPCPTCGESLQKITFHGRGTTFCPQCQPVAASA